MAGSGTKMLSRGSLRDWNAIMVLSLNKCTKRETFSPLSLWFSRTAYSYEIITGIQGDLTKVRNFRPMYLAEKVDDILCIRIDGVTKFGMATDPGRDIFLGVQPHRQPQGVGPIISKFLGQ